MMSPRSGASGVPQSSAKEDALINVPTPTGGASARIVNRRPDRARAAGIEQSGRRGAANDVVARLAHTGLNASLCFRYAWAGRMPARCW